MIRRAWVPIAGLLAVLLPAHPVRAQNPTLVPATLRNIAPAGVTRGGKVTFTLDGINLSRADTVLFDDPAIRGAAAPGKGTGQARVTAEIGAAARIGVHSVYLHTPLGTTSAVTFAVGAWPEVPEKEPNDDLGSAPLATLPCTFVGAIGRVGDADYFRFHAAEGEELVFQIVASQIRSKLQSVLSLLDRDGKVLAESEGSGGPDAFLTYRFNRAGDYGVRVRDYENGGAADMTYRLNVGPFQQADEWFPLGVPRIGGEVTLRGENLGKSRRIPVTAAETGTTTTLLLDHTFSGALLRPVRLAVGDEPEVTEAEPNDTPATAQAVPVPVTINGRIQASDGPDADCFRFHANKGKPLVLDVDARRLGSPLDSVIEVLDLQGRPVERAVLRCVSETVLTLNDRDSVTAGLRLLAWGDLSVGDLVYLRGEVLQLTALPRGPDDDARFRAVRGQRVGLFDTTPVAQAMNTPVYKVQLFPPGTHFPPNGMPVFPLYFRNDDGGPLYGKDSHLTFEAPADGEYVVRIRDVRGEGSSRHAYRLTIREPRPDFRLTMSPENPGIPAGSRVPVEVTADRLDGMEEPIRVHLENLPPGITATDAVIGRGETTATLVLSAAPGATTAVSGSPLRLTGSARVSDGELLRNTEPAGGRARVTVLPPPDVTVDTAEETLTLTPGQEGAVSAVITRQHGFTGRVPADLKNLPYGVRVLDVGLNGVLFPENETRRRIALVCDRWARPVDCWIYCTARTETGSAASTEVAARPIHLIVQAAR